MDIHQENLQTQISEFLMNWGHKGEQFWADAGYGFVLIILVLALFKIFRPSPDFKFEKILQSEFLFIFFIIAGIVVLRLPYASGLELNPDESLWIADGITLQRDPIYWQSVESMRVLTILPLLLIPIFNATINYGTVKVLGSILMALSGVFLYKSFFNLFRDSIARLIVLPYVIWLALITYKDYVAYNSELVVIFFLSLSLFLYSKAVNNQVPKRTLYLYLLGFILGCIPFAKLQAGPIALSITLIALLSTKPKKLVYLIAGGMSFPVILLLYLLLFDLLDEFFLNFSKNLFYASDKDLSLSEKLGLFEIAFFQYFDTCLYFTWQLNLGAAAIVGLIVLRKRVALFDLKLIGLGVITTLISVYTFIQPAHKFAHYLLLMIVPSTFLVGVLLGMVHNGINALNTYKLRQGLHLTLVLAITLSVGYISFKMINKGNLAFTYARINYIRGIDKSRVAQAIAKHAEPGDRMAIWGWADRYYVQTGLPLGARQATIRWVTRDWPYQKDAYKQYLYDLNKNKPEIFLDAVAPGELHYKERKIHGHENYPEVESFIDENYHYVDAISRVRLYVTKERKSDNILRAGIDDVPLDSLKLADQVTSITQSNDLHNYILIEEDENNFIIDNGWAFIENINSAPNRVWLVLKSPSELKLYRTRREMRPEVAAKNRHPYYMHSGFDVTIPKKDLKGQYNMGVIIVSGHKVLGMKFTEKTIFWDSEMTVNEIKKDFKKLSPTKDLYISAELYETDTTYLIKQGWASTECGELGPKMAFIVLRSDQHQYQYVYSTQSPRVDEIIDYDTTGIYTYFTSKISKKQLPEGNYQLGLVLDGSGKRWLNYVNQPITRLPESFSLLNRKQEFQTIGPTHNVESSVKFEFNLKTFEIDSAWAYVSGAKPETTKTIVVLKSDNSFYSYYAPRKLQSHQFSPPVHNDFIFKVNREDLEFGNYSVGVILVDKETVEISGVKYFEDTLAIKPPNIGGYPYNQLITDKVLPQMDKEFKHSMKFEKKGRYIHAEGWAFIEGLNAQEHRIYLVFESKAHTYIIPTIKKRRHELANIFGTEYVGGGFVLSFRSKMLPEDDYRVGILIGKDQEIKGFKFTRMDLSI